MQSVGEFLTAKVTKEALTHKAHKIGEARIAPILEHIREKSKIFLWVKLTCGPVAERSRSHSVICKKLRENFLPQKEQKTFISLNKVKYLMLTKRTKVFKNL